MKSLAVAIGRSLLTSAIVLCPWWWGGGERQERQERPDRCGKHSCSQPRDPVTTAPAEPGEGETTTAPEEGETTTAPGEGETTTAPGTGTGEGTGETHYVTGYTFGDNDPPGSATTSTGKDAGGSGTFADPTTVAVKSGAYDVGTKFYLPYLQKYFVVGDSCASCSDTQLDIWLGDASQGCAASITGNKEAIMNPADGLSVKTGAIC